MASRWAWSEARPSIAILGLGEAGMRHVAAVVNGNFGVIRAIAEPVAERARLARQMLVAAGCSPPRIYTGARALLHGESPDWVVIATPDAFHEDHLRACAAQGARVLIEPPLANSWQEWKQVLLHAAARPRKVFVVSNWRQDPDWGHNQMQLAAPDEKPYWCGNGGLKEWQRSWEAGNGILGPVGFGLLDMATRGLILGEPVRVFATGDGGVERAPRHLMAMCWLSDGTTLGWTEPEWRSGTIGEVTVRNGAEHVLRSVPSNRLRLADRDAGRTMMMWKSIVADVEKKEVSIHRLENFHDNMKLWLSVKTAILSGRTETFPLHSIPLS